MFWCIYIYMRRGFLCLRKAAEMCMQIECPNNQCNETSHKNAACQRKCSKTRTNEFQTKYDGWTEISTQREIIYVMCMQLLLGRLRFSWLESISVLVSEQLSEGDDMVITEKNIII
jgi:hypothetical protein